MTPVRILETSMTPTRRTFLTAATSTGTAVVAGCIGQALPDETNDDNESDGTDCTPIELPLVDAPPHDPHRPAIPDGIDDSDEWDDHHLGDGMEDDTDLEFSRIDLQFNTAVMDAIDLGGDRAVFAELITSREDFDEYVTPMGEENEAIAESIDFDTQVVVAVMTGFGSSSISHEWVRVAESCEEIHVHGYYRWPYIQTSDVAAHVSGIVVERPGGGHLDRAWISLTMEPDERVNFRTDESVQVIDEDDEKSIVNGTIEDIEFVSVTPQTPGDWDWFEDGDERTELSSANAREPGIAVEIPDEGPVKSIAEDSDELDALVDSTDFESDNLYYIESVGPNSCYGSLEIGDIELMADSDGQVVQADVTAIDQSEGESACLEVITYPAGLLRIRSETSVAYGAFSITDGWGNESTVRSETLTDFARE